MLLNGILFFYAFSHISSLMDDTILPNTQNFKAITNFYNKKATKKHATIIKKMFFFLLSRAIG